MLLKGAVGRLELLPEDVHELERGIARRALGVVDQDELTGDARLDDAVGPE